MMFIDSIDAAQVVLLTVLVFAVLPSLLARVIMYSFPKDHPTRAELRGELDAVPMRRRLFWVAGQLDLAIFEGIPARRRQRATRPSGDSDQPEPVTIEAIEIQHGVAVGAVRATITAEGDTMTASGSVITSDGLLANEVAGDLSPLMERSWPTVSRGRSTESGHGGEGHATQQ